MSGRPARDFDWPLLVAALVICGMGVTEIYSAQPTQNFWIKQLITIGIGLALMVFLARVNFQRLFDVVPYFYGATMVLLVLVLIVGVRINGQRCWISMGPLGTLQPSEFAKLGTILMLARVLHPIQRGILTLEKTLVACGVTALPVALIMLEPDTGTALTFFPVLGVLLFLSGLNTRLVAAAIIGGIVLGPLGFQYVVKPRLKQYQIDRINVTVNAIFAPEKLTSREIREGYGYQTLQSMIAVGSGGVTGKGITKGTQSQGGFVPERHTDFIASVLAEEMGFVGCIFMLALYLFIIIHSAHTAERARDRFGMLILAGFVTLLAFHTIINVGMVVGLVPIMGIPLPLLSSGGTSVLMTFMCLGLVANVYQQRFVN
ncbi:MAG: rod shape-determining protein RodA [Blastocatellia bacterium]|nr:rod shape-determining protein RodA [Blastocatellia bacterium]